MNQHANQTVNRVLGTLSTALQATALGRALLAYVIDLPLWSAASVVLALTSTPSLVALAQGHPLYALLFWLPAALVLAGIAGGLAATVDGTTPRPRLFLRGPFIPALTAWTLLAAIGLTFFIELPAPLIIVQCMVALLALMLAPLVGCLPALLPMSAGMAWRNAFVVAVHYPVRALGLAALAVVASVLVLATRGALLLVLPGLWLSIALYTTHEILTEIQQVEKSRETQRAETSHREASQNAF